MKKNILSVILFTLISFACLGNPVDPTTARQVAAHFWSAVTGNSEEGRWTDLTSQTEFQEFYIFTHNADEGFVIVAADDRVQPILGYSTDNQVITPLPPHVASFLQGFELEIAYIREQGLTETEEIASLWNRLIEGEYTPQATTVVTPLLTTTWDQSPIYNNLCPDSAGHHAVTGCSATATAQIMKFWNWPPRGEGSHSYTDDNFGYLSADFGATTYDWEHMPNALSYYSGSTQINAVATLMYHVGVAIEMDYGIHASGAYVHNYGYPNMACSENALRNYFHYKSSLYSMFKDYTSNSDWVSTLTSELDDGRPVLETGYGDGGGHAFVCDGYDANGLFHINWGWGGYMDGYFAHNNLNPGAGGTGGNNGYTFNEGKGILVGIEPDGMLEVSPLQLFFSQAGGNKTITVNPNMNSTSPWYAVSDQPWLTLSPNNGIGTGGSATVTATATANTSGNSRSAIITVSQGSTHLTVQVTQTADSCTIVDIPWFESFEEGTGCWTSIDADGDGNNWFLADGIAYDGQLSMASYSYNNNLGGALHANNYLVSPAISLPAEGDHELVFHARSGNSNYPDTLMVKLATNEGTSISHFGTTLLPLTPVNSSSYQQYSVSLAAFNGQTVKIAIVHKAYDGVYLSIDGISILNTDLDCHINAMSENSAIGSVFGGGEYDAGDLVTLTAVAESGFRFTGWNDGSTVNPREITATGDATYIASFADLGDNEHHYDNGTSTNHMGAGGHLYWGIRFPAGELSDYDSLTGARLWDYDTGNYELRIYQGGSEAPGTLVASQTYALTGSNNAWFDAVLTTPVALDNTQPLWVTFYNSGTAHPATGSHYAGNPDGSWVSTNGNSWNSICNYGYDLTWMVRAMLTGDSSSQHYTITVNSGDLNKGVISGGGRFNSSDSTSISADAFPGYRFTGWNDGNTENPREIAVTSDSSFTALFAGLGDEERHYDNGTFSGSIGAGGSLYWAVRFPAGSLSGHDLLSSVKVMDKSAGTYEVSIYQGGDDDPESLITSQTITLSGSEDWHTTTLATPVSLNHAEPLWIVLHNTGTTHPAAGSHYAGNPDGSWVSVNGEDWASVCDYGYYRTWMIRAGLSDAEPITFYNVSAQSDNTSLGSVIGAGAYPAGETVTLTAMAASHCHFLHWSDSNTTNPRTFTVTSDTNFTAYFEANTYTINVVSEQPDKGTTTGGGTYTYGTVIEIEAIPYTGYEFLRWLGGNTQNPRTVTVTENKTYSALFQEAVGIEDNTMSGVEIYSNGNQIVVNGASGQVVEIYDMTGKLIVHEDRSDSDCRVFTISANGVYLVRLSDGSTKKVTVIR